MAKRVDIASTVIRASASSICWYHVDMKPVTDGTLVTIRCEDVPTGIAAEDHQAGLNSTLVNLAAFVENGA
jgi:hypothetical protein